MTTLAGSRKPFPATVRILISFLLMLLVPATIFTLLALEIAQADGRGWDDSLIPSWTHVRAWWADAGMTIASLFGGGRGMLALASALIGALIVRRRYADALFVALALNGAAVLSRAFKDALDRPRPEMPRSVFGLSGKAALLIAASFVAVLFWTRWRRLGLIVGGVFATLLVASGLLDLWQPTPGRDSFPSGHAVTSMAMVGACVVLAWPTRLRRLTLSGGALLITTAGLSRIYFGLHYTSDVIGGWALALAWVALLTGVRIIRRERQASSMQAKC